MFWDLKQHLVRTCYLCFQDRLLEHRLKKGFFFICGSVHRNSRLKKDATVCRYLFTAKLLYMFRASIAPIIRSSASGTDHTIGGSKLLQT